MHRELLSYLDRVTDDGWLEGWAYFSDAPSDDVRLEVRIGDRVLGAFTADQFRADLVAAGFKKPHCAFFFKLDEASIDPGTHEVAVYVAGQDFQIRNSPQRVRLGSLTAAEHTDETNKIPNSGFKHWPAGVSTNVTTRLMETAAGWYVDFKKGTTPKVCVSLIKPTDLGLKSDEYAMKIFVEEKSDGYLRLVTPLQNGFEEINGLSFSCTIRRPTQGKRPGLAIGEIFLAEMEGTSIRRLSTIRKNVNPQGTVRLIDLPLGAPQEIKPQAKLAIVFEFEGDGELAIALPALRRPGWRSIISQPTLGQFEDENIQNQVTHLKLSRIWQKNTLAVPRIEGGHAPSDKRINYFPRPQCGLPFVQIVIPVFNAADDTADLIESIIKNTISPFEIVLADDYSAPFTELRAPDWLIQDPRVRYFRNQENLGYTRNINIALQATIAQYVVLINSDTVVGPNWLTNLLEIAEADERIAGVGPVSNAASWQSVPVTKNKDGTWAVNQLPAGYTVDSMARLIESISPRAAPVFPLLNGFCTLFRRSALEAVGFYDDECFPQGYGEENDLCIRLVKAGYKLKVADNTYVLHKKSKSFGHEKRAELSKRANTILRSKHPEVDFGAFEEQMKGSLPMVELRARLVDSLGVEDKSLPDAVWSDAQTT